MSSRAKQILNHSGLAIWRPLMTIRAKDTLRPFAKATTSTVGFFLLGNTIMMSPIYFDAKAQSTPPSTEAVEA